MLEQEHGLQTCHNPVKSSFVGNMQIKPPDVTGAQLHGAVRGSGPNFERLQRSNSFSSVDDDWNNMLLPLAHHGECYRGSDVFNQVGPSSPPDSTRMGSLFNSTPEPTARAGNHGEEPGSSIEMGGMSLRVPSCCALHGLSLTCFNPACAAHYCVQVYVEGHKHVAWRAQKVQIASQTYCPSSLS